MPQLSKGGKYVYGWSRISARGRIRIPGEALREYRLKVGDRIILMSGSRTSGGFGLTCKSFLRRSPLVCILDANPRLSSYRLEEGQPRKHGRGYLCWLEIRAGGTIVLPRAARTAYQLKTGDMLMSVRSSDIAIGFAAKGPLIAGGKKHPELVLFEP